MNKPVKYSANSCSTFCARSSVFFAWSSVMRRFCSLVKWEGNEHQTWEHRHNKPLHFRWKTLCLLILKWNPEEQKNEWLLPFGMMQNNDRWLHLSFPFFYPFPRRTDVKMDENLLQEIFKKKQMQTLVFPALLCGRHQAEFHSWVLLCGKIKWRKRRKREESKYYVSLWWPCVSPVTCFCQWCQLDD